MGGKVRPIPDFQFNNPNCCRARAESGIKADSIVWQYLRYQSAPSHNICGRSDLAIVLQKRDSVMKHFYKAA
jgi:hypothetical protein